MDESLFFVIFAITIMKFNCCFLKKRFLLLLIALGIGSVLYANDELKLLTDSLRRVIDEKHVYVQKKEERINRIKCMLKSPGLTLEGSYFTGQIWLEQFSERIVMDLLLFIGIALLVLLVIVACVVVKAWHVANENPVKSNKAD